MAPTDADEDGDMHYWEVWGGAQAGRAYLDSARASCPSTACNRFPDLRTIRAFAGAATWTANRR